jgi:hypothetical protein
MIEAGEDLPLLLELADRQFGVHSEPDEFQGDLHVELVLTHGAIDLSHTTFADRVQETIGADAASRLAAWREGLQQVPSNAGQRRGDETIVTGVGGNEGLEFGAENRIRPAGAFQEGGSLTGSQIDNLREEGFDQSRAGDAGFGIHQSWITYRAPVPSASSAAARRISGKQGRGAGGNEAHFFVTFSRRESIAGSGAEYGKCATLYDMP